VLQGHCKRFAKPLQGGLEEAKSAQIFQPEIAPILKTFVADSQRLLSQLERGPSSYHHKALPRAGW